VPPHLVVRAFLRHVDEPPRSPLVAADAAPGPGHGIEGERDAGAVFRFVLSASGDHRVGVLLEDPRTHRLAALEATPSVVTLAAEGTAQRLSLRVPAASLQRAIDELAR
jgi:hypothetical protein